MDRTIDQSTVSKRKRGKALRYLVIVLGAFALVWLGLRALRPSMDEDTLRMATVERGEVLNTINSQATVLPAFEEQLNAPVATEIEKVYLTAGKEVEEGALLMTLDRDYVRLQLEGRRDQLAVRENSVELLKMEYDRDLKELTYDTDIKKLELAAARAQLADARRLLEVGGATAEEVEAADLKVKITELEYSKLENELNYRKSSIAGRKRALELEVGIEEKEVAQLSRRMKETEVRAPRAGVVTWVNENIGQQVQEGAPLARIADLGRFRVEGTCSDRYADQLTIGMPVELRLPRDRIMGTVTAILPEVNDNTLRFRVELDNPSHEALRPNMRAELSAITEKRENVLRVRNGPAFRGGKRQSIFVLNGQEAYRRDVSIGLRNGDFVEIVDGLKAGDRIIISDTEEYETMNRFSLKE
ncbi:efflux RND transporter periplasmic adaptor subunit [Lewinella sp. W8]|uniref:efflux RND transporter periplasmic adaptor subunit n=1 Tax=Lewinella sp. W8 TaxID=2528208 RepID=UPI001068B935|nr:efflux RND transporter periplasmic adaptor subunit [Lewinella sp. W8]MTB53654.1 efflux RND transporter periplasmic adaptor subunit [Lewinella sp. W8]